MLGKGVFRQQAVNLQPGNETMTIQREQLHTVQLVPITAFDMEGQLNLEPMVRLMARSYEAGIRVFLPCAGSAEFHALQPSEIISVIEMVRDAVGDDAVVVAPTGYHAEHAIELVNQAHAVGADAGLVMPLSFPYLSDAGARDHLLRIFDESKLPMMVYKKGDLPSDELLLELADHDNLVGVKYAVNNMDAFTRVIRADQGRIDWFCGTAERFAPFYALAGAPGYTSGAGNICPRLTLAMHAAMQQGEWEEALRLQEILLPIEYYRSRDNDSYNVSMLKHGIKQTGLDFGVPRPPQRQLDEQEMQEIELLVAPILEAETALSLSPSKSQ
jgi:4-hydroxy-tetrahydrodipicolinate synthase